ncbi:hypothetical protein [Halioxenophilus sp. WMMB6]|uniref:EF-hand domain-containing protein n=1 Tax=Halioxenophilus sp. WMMB6 TaxID=3073815 RepID=UPI00295F00CC|nr:hypothetical protein [Halioxenophilus sp. WMMB6]
MNRWLRNCSLIATVSLFSSITFAADDSQTTRSSWLLAKYDQNGDSRITAEEIALKKHKVFRVMDGDGDGDVDVGEYLHSDAKRREAILKARFDKLDLDHNGKISDSEYSSFLGLFASIDDDGDGHLSASEMSAATPEPSYETRCLWVFCLRTESEE